MQFGLLKDRYVTLFDFQTGQRLQGRAFGLPVRFPVYCSAGSH